MSEDQPATPHDADRERGIFTESDRKFILGEKDLSDQAERNTRYRIRNRLENGIKDLVLANMLDDSDRKQVSERTTSSNNIPQTTNQESLELIFRMICDVSEVDSSDPIENYGEELESIFKHIVKYDDPDALVDVSVDINIDSAHPDPDELLKKYEADEETFEEFRYMEDHELINMDGQFWDHLLRHYWDRDQSLSFATPDGEFATVSPEDHETLPEYRKKGKELMQNLEDELKSGDTDKSDEE